MIVSDPIKVTDRGRWLIFGGGRLERFSCIYIYRLHIYVYACICKPFFVVVNCVIERTNVVRMWIPLFQHTMYIYLCLQRVEELGENLKYIQK